MRVKKKTWGFKAGSLLPSLDFLPYCSLVVVVDGVTTVNRAGVGGSVGAMLLTHGILVDGGIGL